MTFHDDDPTEKELPTCAAITATLQKFLDGVPLAPSPDRDRHLAACAECRERFAVARMIRAALDHRPFPEPAELTTERLVGTVRADFRRRQFYRFSGMLALAASVVVAVWLAYAGWRPNAGPRPAPNDFGQNLPLMREQLTGLGDAAMALAERAGRETFEPLAVRLPEFDPSLLDAEMAAEALEPPEISFDTTRQALASGFGPIADSVKRAGEMFRRDLPLTSPSPGGG